MRALLKLVFLLVSVISPFAADNDCSSAQVLIGNTFIFGSLAASLSGKGQVGTNLLAVITDQAVQIDNADAEGKVTIVVNEILAYIKEHPAKKKEIEDLKIPLFGNIADLLASCSGDADKAISEHKQQLLIEFTMNEGHQYGVYGHPDEGPKSESNKILVGAYHPQSEMGRNIKQFSQACAGRGDHLQFLEQWIDPNGKSFLITANQRKEMKMNKKFSSKGPVAIVGISSGNKCNTVVPVHALRRKDDTMLYVTDEKEYQKLRWVHKDEGIAFYGWHRP